MKKLSHESTQIPTPVDVEGSEAVEKECIHEFLTVSGWEDYTQGYDTIEQDWTGSADHYTHRVTGATCDGCGKELDPKEVRDLMNENLYSQPKFDIITKKETPVSKLTPPKTDESDPLFAFL